MLPTYFQDPSAEAPRPPRVDGQTEEERLKTVASYLMKRFESGSIRVQRLEGGDIPDAFFADDVRFLLDEPRHSELVTVLTQELGAPKTGSAEARLLFQHDLWNRFDALHKLMVDVKDEPAKARGRLLLTLLGKLIARHALRVQELATIRSNFADAARAYPGILDAGLFTSGSPWRELVPRLGSGEYTTVHSTTARFRRIFRVFVLAPEKLGGAACLEASFRAYYERNEGSSSASETGCVRYGSALSYGSRALLVETAVALSDQGALVPVPIVFSVQLREIEPVTPGPQGQLGLEQLRFFVLHLARHELLARTESTGGLKALEADDPVPRFFAAFGRSSSGVSLVPMRLSCPNCHGLDGARLMTTNFHDVTGVHVLRPDNTLQQELVIRRKRADPAYQALKPFFAAP